VVAFAFRFYVWEPHSVVHDLVMPRFRACHGRWFGFTWLAVDVAEREVVGEVVGRHSQWGVGDTARAHSPVMGGQCTGELAEGRGYSPGPSRSLAVGIERASLPLSLFCWHSHLGFLMFASRRSFLGVLRSWWLVTCPWFVLTLHSCFDVVCTPTSLDEGRGEGWAARVCIRGGCSAVVLVVIVFGGGFHGSWRPFGFVSAEY